MDGALMEIGPFRTEGHELVPNNGSWNKNANILFVDQPVGVGLSTSDKDSYLHDLPEMAADMLTFLASYYEIFPDQLEHELYVAGESYAGQYIPYIADAILTRNANVSETETEYNLKGIMIGNGWIDPKNQYPAYLPFAYANGIIESGSSSAAILENKQRECLQSLAEKGSNLTVHDSICERVMNTILQESFQNTGLKKTDPNACINVYDIRLRDTFGACGMNWPEDLETVTPYLQRAEVLNALNIEEDERVSWKECNRAVSSAFSARNSVPSVLLIPDIIEQGVQVLLFNGDQDFICNSEGNERLIRALTWGGVEAPSSGFLEEEGETAQPWYVNGTASGIYQEGRNLTYIKVYNASHMVALDVPEVSQTMLNHFIGIRGYELEKPTDDDNNAQATSKETGETDHSEGDNDSDSDNNDDNKDEEGDGDGSGGETTWKTHSLRGGLLLIILALFASAMFYIVSRNRRLVAEAGQINNRSRNNRFEDSSSARREEDDDEGEIRSSGSGVFNKLLGAIMFWRRGDSGGSSRGGYKRPFFSGNHRAGGGGGGLDDDDEGSSVPLRTLDVNGSRVSLDSIDSLLGVPSDGSQEDERRQISKMV